MNLTQILIQRKTGEYWESVEETTENCKDNSYSENVMEVGYNVVSIMEDDINSRVGQ